MNITDSLNLTARDYLSETHRRSARAFARMAALVEGDGSNPPPIVLKSLVSATVLASVAFLESWVNELLTDCSEGRCDSSPARFIPKACRPRLTMLWPHIEKAEILDKFAISSESITGQRFDRGVKTWDDAVALIRLRNDLVHFKPESETLHDDDPKAAWDVVKLENKIKSKFSQCKFFARQGTTSSFFTRWLSSSCAEWADDSSRSFVNQFVKTCVPGLGSIEPPGLEPLRIEWTA